MSLDYLKVDIGLARQVGFDAAALYALIRGAKRPCDNRGYISVDAGLASKHFGWNRQKVNRERAKLITAGVLSVIGGRNQNDKAQYKLLS